jgi:hypothetical protein
LEIEHAERPRTAGRDRKPRVRSAGRREHGEVQRAAEAVRKNDRTVRELLETRSVTGENRCPTHVCNANSAATRAVPVNGTFDAPMVSGLGPGGPRCGTSPFSSDTSLTDRRGKSRVIFASGPNLNVEANPAVKKLQPGAGVP